MDASAPPWPRFIGHRGIASRAPENTLAGFRRAAASGVRWVEFDVRLTRDGICIVFHDDTLERTTNSQGDVSALTYAEVRDLDAGGWFAPDFRGERVPTFEETISVLAELGLGAVVELKPSRGEERATANAALRILQEKWPAKAPKPIVSSFAEAALDKDINVLESSFHRALLVGAVPADWSSRLQRLDCSMLHADARRLRPDDVGMLQAAGIPVFAYTVNDPAQARELFSWGVASVFSDCPDRLAAALPGI